MCADEQFDQATAAAKRPTHPCARPRAEAEVRDFSPAAQTRATARSRSRWFIRAKSSLFVPTNDETRFTNQVVLPGTVIRVETHLSHRKQTTAHTLTRNVPVHAFLHQSFASRASTHDACRAEDRGATFEPFGASRFAPWGEECENRGMHITRKSLFTATGVAAAALVFGAIAVARQTSTTERKPATHHVATAAPR